MIVGMRFNKQQGERKRAKKRQGSTTTVRQASGSDLRAKEDAEGG
jgi:hypothetical protein